LPYFLLGERPRGGKKLEEFDTKFPVKLRTETQNIREVLEVLLFSVSINQEEEPSFSF